MKKLRDYQITARDMRAAGMSIVKISKELRVSKSSVSIWVRDIILTEEQKDALSNKSRDKIRICKSCGNEFEVTREKRDNIYCSLYCYANYIRGKPKKEKSHCLFCGSDSVRKFCSAECYNSHNWKVKIKKSNETGMSPSHPATAKTLIKKMRGNRCEICLGEKWMESPIPLVLDHINGNSEDWRLENLRLVCGNCDMMLPTYKSKNRGRGRKYQREYQRKLAAKNLL